MDGTRYNIKINGIVSYMCIHARYHMIWNKIDIITMTFRGRPQDLGSRGGPINFFSDLASRHAAHGEAMRIARGVQGHAPQRIFLKRCNLVRFRVF